MSDVIIGIDASRAESAVATGTERYSREVIAALMHLAPQHEFRLYTRARERESSGADGSLHPLSSSSLSPLPGSHASVLPLSPRRLWTHIGLAREIARHPPDALFIPAHVLPLPQAIWRTTRSVVTIHDVGYRYYPEAHAWQQRLYLDWSTAFTVRHAWRVVVDSQATLRDVQHFYHVPDEKLQVAYPGPLPLVEVSAEMVQAARARFALPPERPYAFYVGTLQPRKNLRRLIAAWQQVVRTCEQIEHPLLVLAGGAGWGGEDLAAEVRARDMQDAVRLCGYISDAEKSALMRNARALAYPSLYEGFGFPILEAQSVGVPVVCSNTSSLPEVAGDAALMVNPLDEDAIADALRQALFDAATRARLSQSGYANVKRFSWQRCAQVILTLLENA